MEKQKPVRTRIEQALKMKVLGGKLFGFCLGCLVFGRIFVAIFLPEQQGQGLTMGWLLILIPIWAIGVSGLFIFFAGSIVGRFSKTGLDPVTGPPFFPPAANFAEEIFFDLEGYRRLIFDDSSVRYVAKESYFLFWRTTDRLIPYHSIRSVGVLRKRQWWALVMGILMTPFWLFCIGAGTVNSNVAMIAVAAFWLLLTGAFPLWLFFRGRPFLSIASEQVAIHLPMDRHKLELCRAVSILRYFVRSPDVDWGIQSSPVSQAPA